MFEKFEPSLCLTSIEISSCMVALYTEGFCITNICFSLDIYVKLIKSLPNQATQLTASPPPLGTEKDRKSKSSSFLSSVPKYKYRVLLFYMELLKCHSIFVRFFIGSNKFVDLSIVIFKPPGYFPSSSCHLNCRRYSTLDELLFCYEITDHFPQMPFS